MAYRLAAILAADVVSYSRLMRLNETGTLAVLKGHRRELIDPEVARNGGRLVSTKGDSILVEFTSVIAAVECAVAIQKGMADRNRDIPFDERLEFRIGINLDEVIEEDEDIFGDGVNVAARLEAFADPGTVCVSGSVFERVKSRVAYTFDDLGAQQFKNIGEPLPVFRLNPYNTAIEDHAAVSKLQAITLSHKPSIAALPFANLSDDPAYDYFADGLRLDIQAALVHASGLFLIAPAAVAQYCSRGITAEQAGRDLGVRYILEGAVRRSGQRVRVTVELTDTIARRIVWAERYDRVLDDGFAVQDEIVAEVLKALDVTLACGERRLISGSPRNFEAVDIFYRGLSHFYAGTKEDNAAAREAFEALNALQPNSPIGPAYLCFTHWNDVFKGWAGSKEQSLSAAEQWARRAASEWGNNGLPHIVLASVHLLNRHHDAALCESYRAIELRPNCPTANCCLGAILNYCGRPAEAIAQAEQAIRLARIYPAWYVTVLATAYRDSGEIDRSISATEHGLTMSPYDRDLRIILCTARSLAGQWQQAQSIGRDIIAAEPTFSFRTYLEAQPYRERSTLDRLSDALRQAGLSE